MAWRPSWLGSQERAGPGWGETVLLPVKPLPCTLCFFNVALWPRLSLARSPEGEGQPGRREASGSAFARAPSLFILNWEGGPSPRSPQRNCTRRKSGVDNEKVFSLL